MLVNGTKQLLDIKRRILQILDSNSPFLLPAYVKRKKSHIFYLISRIFQDYIEYIFLEGLVDKYGLIED